MAGGRRSRQPPPERLWTARQADDAGRRCPTDDEHQQPGVHQPSNAREVHLLRGACEPAVVLVRAATRYQVAGGGGRRLGDSDLAADLLARLRYQPINYRSSGRLVATARKSCAQQFGRGRLRRAVPARKATRLPLHCVRTEHLLRQHAPWQSTPASGPDNDRAARHRPWHVHGPSTPWCIGITHCH